MKPNFIFISITIGLAAFASLTSCSTTSEPSVRTSGTESAANNVILDKSLAAAHQSGLDALAKIGANVKKNEPTYMEGRRPNKIGLVVGSGGETVKIWFTAQSAGKTAVKVKTVKSLVGIAGQRNWDSEVITAMQQ